jgi:hypothetical protein
LVISKYQRENERLRAAQSAIKIVLHSPTSVSRDEAFSNHLSLPKSWKLVVLNRLVDIGGVRREGGSRDTRYVCEDPKILQGLLDDSALLSEFLWPSDEPEVVPVVAPTAVSEESPLACLVASLENLRQLGVVLLSKMEDIEARLGAVEEHLDDALDESGAEDGGDEPEAPNFTDEWLLRKGGEVVRPRDLASQYGGETGISISERTIRRRLMRLGARRLGYGKYSVPSAEGEGVKSISGGSPVEPASDEDSLVETVLDGCEHDGRQGQAETVEQDDR